MSKASTKKEPLEDFENLVRNGIDFLKKAISQLESDPKHSVINFYTAVEIFLKAPLVHEHWTLVVGDRDFNRSKYEAGDFLSVNFEDTCKRLATALGKQLKPSAKEAFDKVRKHRNRMVHFYHDGIDGLQRDEIKLEQAQAWFELNRFIFDTWRDKFAPFRAELLQMERHLIAYNHYAQAKYESLKLKVEAMKIEGKHFEPPRVLRRLRYLRQWSHHEQNPNQIYPRSARASSSHDARSPQRISIALVSH